MASITKKKHPQEEVEEVQSASSNTADSGEDTISSEESGHDSNIEESGSDEEYTDSGEEDEEQVEDGEDDDDEDYEDEEDEQDEDDDSNSNGEEESDEPLIVQLPTITISSPNEKKPLKTRTSALSLVESVTSSSIDAPLIQAPSNIPSAPSEKSDIGSESFSDHDNEISSNKSSNNPSKSNNIEVLSLMTSLAETVSLDESLDSSNYEDVGKIIDSGTNQPSNLESSVETLNNALNITPKKNPGFSIPIPQPFASATAIDTRGQQKSEPASTQPTSWLNNLGLFKMFDSPPKPSVVPVPQVLVSLVQEPGLKRCASTETFVSANSSAAAVTESEDLSSKTLSSAIPTTTSITALPIKLQLQELMESLESERLAHKETSIQLKTITETLNSETASKNQIQEELEKSNALIEELRNSLKQSNEFLLSQESSNKTLVQQISVMESHQTELNQQLESTKKELKSRDEELKGLTAAHPKKLNEVESTLNKKIKASEAKLLASVNEFNAYKKDAQVKEGEWKQKEKDLVTQAENAEEVVKNETAAKSVLEIELEKLKKELNEGKEGLVAEHKMAVEGLESRLNNAAEEGAAAKLKLESMEKKVTELEKREKEGLKKLKELEAIVQTGKSVVAALESDKKKLQDDLTASEKIKLDLALHVTKVKELELRNVELTKSVERLKEESSARGEAIESKEIRIKELEREMEDQESANQQVSDSLESAESKINQLESIVNQLTQQLQESRTSLETAQAHSQFLEGKLCIEQTKLTQLRDASTPTETPTTVDTSKYKSKISELEQQLSTLEATKAAAELQSKETSQSLETLKSTNEELQKTLIKAKIERRLRASRISELWNELQNAKKDGDEKTAELEKTRKMFMERVAALEEQIEQQSQQRQNVDVNQTRAQELESKLLEREAQIMRERDEWTQTQQKLLEGQQQKEVDVRMVREELNSVKESFKESCAKKDAMIRELTESLAIEKARISEDRSGIVSASNEPLSNEPGSLMSEVLSELMTQTVNQPDDHAIGKAWLEEWYKTRAPLESNNCLKEISQVLGTKLPESSNLETAKTEIIHSIETQKSRVTQLESVCRELEAFAKDALEAAKLMELKYTNSKVESEQKEQVITRLHNVLEDGASVMGKKRLQSVIAATRVAVSQSQSRRTSSSDYGSMRSSMAEYPDGRRSSGGASSGNRRESARMSMMGVGPLVEEPIEEPHAAAPAKTRFQAIAGLARISAALSKK